MNAFVELSQTFMGAVVEPATPLFDTLRRIHSGLIDRRPAVIAQCRGMADIADVSASPAPRGWRSRLAAAVAAYGPNLPRPRRLKKQYEPENVFHLNLNIPPA